MSESAPRISDEVKGAIRELDRQGRVSYHSLVDQLEIAWPAILPLLCGEPESGKPYWCRHESRMRADCPDCNREMQRAKAEREAAEDEWVCDTCGATTPIETAAGWEQTAQDDAGVSVERCAGCRLTPDERIAKAEQELEQAKADLEHERTEASRYQDERDDVEAGREEFAARADRLTQQLSQVREEVERLRDEAKGLREAAHSEGDPDSYGAAAKRGQARGREIAADRLQAILVSSPSVSGGDGDLLSKPVPADEVLGILKDYEAPPELVDDPRQVIVDFLASWRFCPVSTASAPARSCLEDAASQLLAALTQPENGTTNTSLSGDVEERGEEEGDELPAGERAELLQWAGSLAAHADLMAGKCEEANKPEFHLCWAEAARVYKAFTHKLKHPTTQQSSTTGNSLSGEPDLVKALAVAVLGGFYDDSLPEDLYADPYEAEGLLKTSRDACDEYVTLVTPKGREFIHDVLTRSLTQPKDTHLSGEKGNTDA